MSESGETVRRDGTRSGPAPPLSVIAKTRIPLSSEPDLTRGPIRYLATGALLLLSAGALLIALVGISAAPALIAVAYVVARLRLVLGRVGEDERWLLYPPLLVGTLILLGVVLCWPLGLAILLGRWSGFVAYYPTLLGPAPASGSFGYWYQVIASALMVMGAWWVLLGGRMVRNPVPMKELLRPFLQRWVPEFGRWLIAGGLVAVIIGAVALLILTW